MEEKNNIACDDFSYVSEGTHGPGIIIIGMSLGWQFDILYSVWHEILRFQLNDFNFYVCVTSLERKPTHITTATM